MKAFRKADICELQPSEIILYGTGALGEIALAGMQQLDMAPDLFCSDDPREHIYRGYPVIHPDELCRHREAAIIVAFKDYLKKALQKVSDAGCTHLFHIGPLLDLDYSACTLSDRAKEILVRKRSYQLTVLSAMEQQTLSTQHIEIMVTERCTMRCRDCSALIPFFQHPSDIDFPQYWDALDRLFGVFDSISEVSLLGGETFLHPALWQFIERYVDRANIGMLAIYTNGTVLPDERTLAALAHPKIWIHISDYQKIADQIPQIEALFQRYNIQYHIRKYEEWQASGDFSLRPDDARQLCLKYKNCFKANCFSFYRGKLYPCSRAASAIEAGILPAEDGAFLDFRRDIPLRTLKADTIEFLNQCYSPMCRFCDGFQMNRAGVEPAIQI